MIAPATGLPHGALSGTYTGVGAQASAGAGVGANVLVGGTGRAFSLQPVSVQGQTGLNIAGGVTTVTLLLPPPPPSDCRIVRRKSGPIRAAPEAFAS